MRITGVFCILVAGLVQSAFSTTTTSIESTSIPDGCPSDLSWEPHNQSCYLHLGVKLNFTQANESCEELGAHLVSISNGEENEFIVDFVGKEPVWIGLYRTTNEFCLGEVCANWMWLDGSELRYSQWATDPFPTPGQCTFMNSLGDWYHNTQCSGQFAYVCEQKRIFPVTISESTTAMIHSDMTKTSLSDPVVSVVPTTDSREDGINVPLVVGCVVGCLVVVGIVTAVAVTTGKRHRQSSTNEQQNTNKRGNSFTTDIENNSPPRDLLKESKDGKISQRNQSNVDEDIDSSPTDELKKCIKEDRPTEGVNGRLNRGCCYEDVEAEMTIEGFKRGPAISDIGARARELTPDNIYAEPIKKKDR